MIVFDRWKTSVYLWATSLLQVKFTNGSQNIVFSPESQSSKLDEESHCIRIHGSILLDLFIALDRKKPFSCECFHNSSTLWPTHMPANATSCFAFESEIKWNMRMIFDKIEVIIPLCRWCLVNFLISLMVLGLLRKCVIKFLVKSPFPDFLWYEWITGELTKKRWTWEKNASLLKKILNRNTSIRLLWMSKVLLRSKVGSPSLHNCNLPVWINPKVFGHDLLQHNTT